MEDRLVESIANFSFHLDGESSVDATLLANAISEMAELTKQTAIIENPDSYVRLKVSAFKNGSFEILFSTVCYAADSIISNPAAITFAASITTIVVGYFEIKKHLKGKNPKKVERKANGVHIENCDGQTIVANNGSENIVNNMHIDQLVTNVVVYAQSNDSSHGFTVSDKVHSVTCTPDDIQHMSKPLPIQEKFTSICSRANVTLAIKKPDLLGYSMWSFKLNGRTIEASMGDKYWLEKVHNGDIVIRAHDCISTSLETVIETDESGVPIENSTRYTVMQVYELFSSYGENTQSKL